MARKLPVTKKQLALIPKNTTVELDGFEWQVIGISLTKTVPGKIYWTIRRFGVKVVNKVKVTGAIIERILQSELLKAISRYEAAKAALEAGFTTARKRMTRKLGHRQRQIA